MVIAYATHFPLAILTKCSFPLVVAFARGLFGNPICVFVVDNCKSSSHGCESHAQACLEYFGHRDLFAPANPSSFSIGEEANYIRVRAGTGLPWLCAYVTELLAASTSSPLLVMVNFRLYFVLTAYGSSPRLARPLFCSWDIAATPLR